MSGLNCACSGIGNEEHYDFSLENQAGEAVLLDRGDREALVMGLSLADKGHRTMEQARGTPSGILSGLHLLSSSASQRNPGLSPCCSSKPSMKENTHSADNDVRHTMACRPKLPGSCA